MNLWIMFFVLDCYFLFRCRGHLQDHIVIWDESNDLFRNGTAHMKVNQGDNIIFICDRYGLRAPQLFWTLDSLAFHSCRVDNSSQVIKLLDCQDYEASPEFILKVAPFSEIGFTPTFRQGKTVYFVSQPGLCMSKNLRLSVDLFNNAKEETEANIQEKFKAGLPGTKLVTNHTLELQSSVMNVGTVAPNEDQTAWYRYRFLLIPSTLGIFTITGIIGASFVICRAKTRSSKCCCCYRCKASPLSVDKSLIDPIETKTPSEPTKEDHTRANPRSSVNEMSQKSFENHEWRLGIGGVPQHLFKNNQSKEHSCNKSKPRLSNGTLQRQQNKPDNIPEYPRKGLLREVNPPLCQLFNSVDAEPSPPDKQLSDPLQDHVCYYTCTPTNQSSKRITNVEPDTVILISKTAFWSESGNVLNITV